MTTAEPHSLSEYEALLRADFASFAQYCFHELNPRSQLTLSWFHEIIVAQLEAARAGRSRRVIINMAPRHLKSHLASVCFPAWCLGHDPSAQILCASYARDLADKLSRDCRQIVASAWYRQLFTTRLSAQRQAVSEFETTAQGCRLATSVGGVLTGRGANMIIIDNPLKPEGALSQVQRQAANDLTTPFTAGSTTPAARAIIVIMHRLHEDDLADHVMVQEDWDVVRFPAIVEEDEMWALDNELGQFVFTRQHGEALHPERQSLATLDQIRRTIGEYNFACQYQQAPAPQGGGMTKAVWFRSYAPNERPEKFDQIVQSWDTANKASKLSGFSVCTSWGIKGKDLYLLHVLRKRMEYPELKARSASNARPSQRMSR